MKNSKQIISKVLITILITLIFLTSGRLNASNPGITEPEDMTINISQIRSSSFTVSWIAVPDATSYQLSVKLAEFGYSYWYFNPFWPGFDHKVLSFNTTSYNVTGIIPTTQHDYDCRIMVDAMQGATVLDNNFIVIRLLSLPPNVKSITNVTSSSFDISWQQNTVVPRDHRLSLSKRNGAIWEAVAGYPKTISKPTDSKHVTNLESGTEFRVTLQSLDTEGRWSDWFEDMILTKPAAPVAKAATSITANTFTANWNASSGATGYKFYMKEKVSGRQVYNGNATPFTQFLTSGLEAGMQYEYQVSAVNETGESAKSNTITVTTLVLSTPVAISANSITTSSFNARWNAVADATGYLLSVSDGNVWTNYDVAGTSKSVTGLLSNKSYQYKVKAKIGSSISAFSNVIDVVTKPNAPAANAATNITSTSFKTSWSAVAGAKGYKLWVISTTNTGFNPAGFFPKNIGNVTNYSITGLTAGIGYSYWVQAVTSLNESLASNIVEVTTIPNSPTANDATQINETSFKANWSAVENASAYKISVWKKQGGQYVDGFNGEIVEGTSVAVKGLLPQTVYQYRVKSIANGTESNWSANTIDVTTTASTVIPPVAQPATDITTTSFVANWNAVAGATGYKLWVYSNANTGYNPAGFFPKTIGNVTTYNITGLTSGHSYKYFVQVITSNGESTSSNSIVAITKPVTPAAMNASNITSNSFRANWQTVIGATGYKLSVWRTSDYNWLPGYNGKIITGTSEVITGLEPSTEYQYRLRALAGETESDNSNYITVSTIAGQVLTYTLSLNSSPAGAGTLSGGGTFNAGTNVTAHAAANQGYNFVNWTENGIVVSESNSNAFQINSNRNLVANFIQTVQKTYTVVVTPSHANKGAVKGNGTYKHGSTVTVTAIPSMKTYKFENWTENGSIVSTDASYSFTISADRNLVANFGGQQVTNYTLDLASSPSGTGTLTGAGTFASGSSVTVTATPATGYNFVNWTEGGTQVSTSASYSFNIQTNRNLVANFAKQTFTITLSSNPSSGGFTNFTSSIFSYGQNVTINANANNKFINWTENGVEVSDQLSYTFIAVEDRSIVANFELFNGIGSQELANVKLFPNPANEYLMISGASKGDVIKMTTLAGAIVKQIIAINSNERINIELLKRGNYIISIENRNRIYSAFVVCK